MASQSPTSQSPPPRSPPPNALPKKPSNPFLTKRQRFKSGMRMEAWKFSLYLLIPVVASAYFNNPDTQKYWADYFQYIRYPPVQESFQDLVEEYRKRLTTQQEQRKVIAEQMNSLHDSAERSRQYQEQLQKEKAKSNNNVVAMTESSKKSGSWSRWIPWGNKDQKKQNEESTD